MAQFAMYSNNGVRAVVPEEVLQQIRWWEGMRSEATVADQPFVAPYPKPVFTFSDAPGLQGVVTGTIADMEELLAGHEVPYHFIYVPFSNCGGSAKVLYRQAVEEGDLGDLVFRTTLRQVMDAFGLVPASRAPAAAY